MTYLALALLALIIILIIVMILEQKDQKKHTEKHLKLIEDQAHYIRKLEEDYRRLAEAYTKISK